MLGSYQWHSNSAPLCKRRDTKGREKREEKWDRRDIEEKSKEGKQGVRKVKEGGQEEDQGYQNKKHNLYRNI